MPKPAYRDDPLIHEKILSTAHLYLELEHTYNELERRDEMCTQIRNSMRMDDAQREKMWRARNEIEAAQGKVAGAMRECENVLMALLSNRTEYEGVSSREKIQKLLKSLKDSSPTRPVSPSIHAKSAPPPKDHDNVFDSLVSGAEDAMLAARQAISNVWHWRHPPRKLWQGSQIMCQACMKPVFQIARF
jgi:hypothetical protein